MVDAAQVPEDIPVRVRWNESARRDSAMPGNLDDPMRRHHRRAECFQRRVYRVGHPKLGGVAARFGPTVVSDLVRSKKRLARTGNPSQRPPARVPPTGPGIEKPRRGGALRESNASIQARRRRVAAKPSKLAPTSSRVAGSGTLAAGVISRSALSNASVENSLKSNQP